MALRWYVVHVYSGFENKVKTALEERIAAAPHPEKFDQFKAGSDFVAWACRIALWEIRRVRQKHARSKVIFDQTVLEAVSKTAITMIEEIDSRHDILSSCLDKSPLRDREMILTRYEPDCGVKEAAARSGRTLQTAYKALARIRKLLMDCVTNQLEIRGV